MFELSLANGDCNRVLAGRSTPDGNVPPCITLLPKSQLSLTNSFFVFAIISHVLYFFTILCYSAFCIRHCDYCRRLESNYGNFYEVHFEFEQEVISQRIVKITMSVAPAMRPPPLLLRPKWDSPKTFNKDNRFRCKSNSLYKKTSR